MSFYFYKSKPELIDLEILNNYNHNKLTVQHPDLDDETRTIKRNAGKIINYFSSLI